MKKMKDPK